jgi:hypothetical protein
MFNLIVFILCIIKVIIAICQNDIVDILTFTLLGIGNLMFAISILKKRK